MKLAILTMTALAVSGVTPSAFAMSNCGNRDHVISSLSDRFSERHVASGFQSEAGLMEIWASDTDSTWTILLTRPDGQTCIMASGTHWLENSMVPASGDPA